MRGVIARIGNEAGLDAIYWRGGVYVYETTTRSRALIEESITPDSWRGTVRLATKGGQGGELMARLAGWIVEENERLGLRPEVTGSAVGNSYPSPLAGREPAPDVIGGRRALRAPGEGPTPGPERVPAPHPGPLPASGERGTPSLVFGADPATEPHYCVSYAWGDSGNPDRAAIVDRLCAEAERRGLRILRDKNDMRAGDRISAFMHRLAEGRCVFVILSEKYLRSIYCMTELYEIWLNCKGKDKLFLDRVRVYTLPDAKIADLFERAEHAAWWQERHARVKALVDKHGQDFLSDGDYAEFRRMGHFVRHVPDILSLVQDTLRPRSFDDLVRHGLRDPDAPPKTGP